jgi:hypothetical protein
MPFIYLLFVNAELKFRLECLMAVSFFKGGGRWVAGAGRWAIGAGRWAVGGRK